MIVYAKKVDTVIWSQRNKNHKEGKVPRLEPLVVENEYGMWYRIKRPKNLVEAPEPRRERYFVLIEDTLATLPEPDLSEISDEQAAWAIAVLLKWLRQSG